MPAVLESAHTLLYYPFGGFMTRTPLPDAPTYGHCVRKGRHDAAAAIVRHRQWPRAPALLPNGARQDTAGGKKSTDTSFLDP